MAAARSSGLPDILRDAGLYALVTFGLCIPIVAYRTEAGPTGLELSPRWKLVAGSDAIAIWFGALGFALLHTPNASLMLATFAGGLCWCTLYLRERALLPLAVSHAASAMVLIALLPPSWLYSAEVSARFFQ